MNLKWLLNQGIQFLKDCFPDINNEDDPSLDRTEKLNKDYISWLLNFDKNERDKILEKLNKLKLEKKIVIIDNDNKKDLFLQSIA